MDTVMRGNGEHFRSDRGMLDRCEDGRREPPRNVRSETDLNFGVFIKLRGMGIFQYHAP